MRLQTALAKAIEMAMFVGFLLMLWLLAGAFRADGQSAIVPITGHFSDGSGNPVTGAYLDAVLNGCAGNPPRVFGSFTVVKGEVQLPIDPTSQLISGALAANDKINCGGIAGTTTWNLTPVVNNVAQGPSTCYQVLSTGQVPFNLDTAIPCLTVTPPPGPPAPADGYFTNLTLTGILSGTSAIFSGTVNAACFFETSAGPTDLCNFPGADYGAQIVAAEASATPGQARTWIVNKNGTASTPFTLGLNHSLAINATLTMATQGALSGQNSVWCGPGGGIIATTTPATGTFTLPDGAAGVSVQNCHDEANFTYLTQTPSGHTVDLLVAKNYIHNGGWHLQNSASPTNPTLRFHSFQNTAVFDNPSPGIIGAIMYGGNQDFKMDGDSCTQTAHCHEVYALDGGSFPSYATIQADGLRNGSITNTTCRDVFYACDWTSGADYVTIGQGSIAQNSGDVAFDHEAAGHVKIDGATCYDPTGGAGCFTLFFVSTASVIQNSICSVSSGPCVALKNANQANLGNINNTLISGVTFDEITSNVAGTFLSLDSNQGTTVQLSKITNGIMTAPGYSAGLNIRSNTFTFTVPNTGIGLPVLRNGALNVFADNTVQSLTTEAAGTAAISATNIDFNYLNTFLLYRNTTLGFPVDVQVQNNGGNVPATFVLRDNNLGSGSVVRGTSSASVNLTCTNNYSLSGTTPIACN